jgi:hypothetical protein
MIALAEPNAARIAELLDAKHGGALRVLDVAAGHGACGIAILRANPAARVVALDYPGVVEVAAEGASAAGFAARHSTLADDAHVLGLGGPYDLIATGTPVNGSNANPFSTAAGGTFGFALPAASSRPAEYDLYVTAP